MSETGPAPVTLSSPEGVAPGPGYHHLARAGDFLFLAGQIGRAPDGSLAGPDVSAQAAQAWRNVEAILASAGAGPADVVKVTTMLVDRADNPAATAARLAFFGALRPPHTGLIVAGLGGPEVRIEVDLVAYLPQR